MRPLAALCLALLFAAPSARAVTVRFLVTELRGDVAHGDSFVLPISGPEAIAHARDLVARGPEAGARIVFARITAGGDGVNRDLLAPGAPAWSWHVTELLGFADLGAEIYDGWPTFVENDVAGWIANTGGTIGFWSYTVTAELETVPETGTALLAGIGLVGLAVRRRAQATARAASTKSATLAVSATPNASDRRTSRFVT